MPKVTEWNLKPPSTATPPVPPLLPRRRTSAASRPYTISRDIRGLGPQPPGLLLFPRITGIAGTGVPGLLGQPTGRISAASRPYGQERMGKAGPLLDPGYLQRLQQRAAPSVQATIGTPGYEAYQARLRQWAAPYAGTTIGTPAYEARMAEAGLKLNPPKLPKSKWENTAYEASRIRYGGGFGGRSASYSGLGLFNWRIGY